MTLETVLDHISAGSFVSILVIILGLIEITPIKISPLQWIGKRVNKETLDKVDGIEKKLNEHIAQSNRNKIFSFQNELLNGKFHTQEEFAEVLEACESYEKFCKDNALKNEKCTLAIDYIERVYKKCQDERSFLDIKKEVGNE